MCLILEYHPLIIDRVSKQDKLTIQPISRSDTQKQVLLKKLIRWIGVLYRMMKINC